MSRKSQFITLALVAGVSVVFGMLLASGPLRQPGTPESAVWSPAVAAPPQIPLSQPTASFADVAEAANPAVVSIENVSFKKVENPHQGLEGPWNDPFFRRFFGPNVPDEGEGQGGGDDEMEQRLESGGSGFIISEDGYILTNHHVIEDASKINVTLEDGQTYEAELIGDDPMIDLALIRIDAGKPLPVLSLGDSDALRVGEWVIAIGNPIGYEHTVTVGVVSGKGRQLRDPGASALSLANFIQTDAAINFGNSGGPLLNARGEVVGINTAITRGGGPFTTGMIQGIGFALPINQARSVIDQLKNTGKVERGYLGISISAVRPSDKEAFKLPEASGAFVQDVLPGLPAYKAGIEPGDVIVSVDGRKVATTNELITLISSKKPGETAELGLYRDGKKEFLKVRLADRAQELSANRDSSGERGDEQHSEGAAEAGKAEKLGIRVQEITPEIERSPGFPRNHPAGVLVESVKPSSNAYEEGLRQDMIITKINSTPVKNVEDFRKAMSDVRPGDYVKMYTRYYTQSGENGRFVVFKAEE